MCATIVREDEVLLVKHSDPGKPDYHDWILPAGKLESGEGAEEGLHREVKEETGLDIRVARRLTEHADPYTGDRLVNFLCLPVTARIKASPELAKAMWFDKRGIQRLRNIHPELRRFLVDGLEANAFRG